MSLPHFESNLSLRYMDISKNNIRGAIPSSLGNCTNLTEINLSMNRLTGIIPSELGQLVNIEILDLAHNNLEGPLPPQLSNCAKMDRFDVGFNFLNGSFPSSLRTWKRIATLILRENHFTGGIPGFLSELYMLRELQLGGNLLGGEIPRSMGKLQQLFYGLNLSANGLTGEIPSEIRNLQELQSLDLSLNNLSGSIDVLDDLGSLIEVNISYNFFSGTLPKNVMKLLYSSPSSFMGNPHLCVNSPSSLDLNYTKISHLKACVYKSTDHIGINTFVIVIIELGSSVLVSAMLMALVCLYMRRKWKQESSMDWPFSMTRVPGTDAYYKEVRDLAESQYASLHDLVMKATDNLDDRYVIGSGAHGVVYKAQLGPNNVLAVKKVVFGSNKSKYLRILQNEIKALRNKHQNLVTCRGYWFARDFGLIVSDYMENGSLHDILHDKYPPPPLSWKVRFKIAVGVARGLAYLHHDCTPCILHRDIKPRNILLDASMEPFITDFGTALFRRIRALTYETDREIHPQRRPMLSTFIAGTAGYIAPENAYAIAPSRKSDVYSYGVVLLEILTRKKVVVMALIEEKEQETHLVSWVRSVWLKTGKIKEIVDSDLSSLFEHSGIVQKQVTEVLKLALTCTERDPENRPTMQHVDYIYQGELFKR
ncbi:unnamed protein product [Lupinus luteus]|uniref:Protein kinase domain-containing protein n=1 Tax=Lupinus luteus TaxID=3873 RepID=A0AAV1X791_LUPLU